jgi:glycosyltransferase involved in cell wall biosynthesis
MLIGIDANEANVVSRVGISEYAYQVLLKLYEFRRDNKINHSFVIYLKSQPLEGLPTPTDWWEYKIVKPTKLWTQLGLPFNLLRTFKKPDVFLSLTHYLPRFTTIPTVVSVMDLSFVHFPQTFRRGELYQLTRWTKYSVKMAKKVITISQSSKNDIIKTYKVDAKDVKVVHLGLKELSMETTPNNLKKFGITGRFILFVGTLQPRKNIIRLIKAFSLLPQDLKDTHQLVIIGRKGWLYEDILKTPSMLGVEDQVLFLESVTDRDLPLFYKKAEVFVLPSLYEGFGLPILEAMRFGCPVVTSNVSSLPEAGGDAALYFNPEDIEDMKSTIEKVLNDKTIRDKMIESGRIHYKKFTWEKAAKEVLETLEEVGR